jgi:hypothetical protein
MSDTPEQALPPSLRFLKALVIALMITLIGGVIAMVFVLVTRLPGAATLPRLPDTLVLPAGAVAQTVTFGPGWIGLVTTDGRFLLFRDAGGAPVQELRLNLPAGG